MSNYSTTSVLLSYSHKDTTLRRYIQYQLSKLCGDKVQILSDENAETGELLHAEISKLVNKVDIIIPIITRNWLSSNETRDELTRANERRRYIYPLINANENPKVTIEELPHFLRDSLYFNYDEEGNNDLTVLISLAEKLKRFQHHWRRKIFEEIRKIGDAITLNDSPLERQKEYAFQEVELLKRDLDRLFRGEEFRRNVSYESNFLTHANPFFKCASKIFAVSIIKVSSFWTNVSTVEAVINYLKEQSKGNKPIRRLFVFESPSEANKFKNILEANYSHYGRSGGAVLICSKSVYRKFLNTCGIDHFDDDIDFNKDFAVLGYEYDGQTTFLEATLDPRELIIKNLNPGRNEFYSNFMNHLEKFSQLADGEANSLGIAKWSSMFSKREHCVEWSNILKKVFVDYSEKITHMVLLKSTSNPKTRNKIYEMLLSIKSSFDDKSKFPKKSFTSITILKNLAKSEGFDGRFHGTLVIHSDYDFAFVVNFASKTDLENYYQDIFHSEARQKLYELINPKVKEMYKSLKKSSINNFERGAKFYAIEEEMKNYILRLDFTDDLPIEFIAQQKGIEFGKLKN